MQSPALAIEGQVAVFARRTKAGLSSWPAATTVWSNLRRATSSFSGDWQLCVEAHQSTAVDADTTVFVIVNDK
jgi:hypothetical protein